MAAMPSPLQVGERERVDLRGRLENREERERRSPEVVVTSASMDVHIYAGASVRCLDLLPSHRWPAPWFTSSSPSHD